MSRLYQAMTGTDPVAPAPAASMTPDDGVWENSPEEVPYIEIGGPEGPVGSVIASADFGDKDCTISGAAETPQSRSTSASHARPYPRLAEASQPVYLSVRFHDFPAVRRGSPSSTTEPDSSLIVFHQPQHPISFEYKEVWQAITQQCQAGTHRLVYFVAATGESGTTTVVLNLAIQAARQRGQVLVVDAHLERPAAAGRLGLSPSPGLTEVLLGQCPLTLAVQPTCVERLHFLGSGTSSVSQEQVGRSLPLVLSQLRQWYDWVLVDAGVWGEMPQRDAACVVADAVYVVARDADVVGARVSQLRVQVRHLGVQARGAVATRLA